MRDQRWYASSVASLLARAHKSADAAFGWLILIVAKFTAGVIQRAERRRTAPTSPGPRKERGHLQDDHSSCDAVSGRITSMRWWMGCSAQDRRQAVFADVPHLRGEETAQKCEWTPLAMEKVNRGE